MTAGERFALGSIGLGCLVLGLKSLAWWLTGSAALYSDALESIVNVAASAVALVALRFAARPADAKHPYGHDKAEFFSAVIEGVMIVIAAVSIFDESWHAWRTPRTFNLPRPGPGAQRGGDADQRSAGPGSCCAPANGCDPRRCMPTGGIWCPTS